MPHAAVFTHVQVNTKSKDPVGDRSQIAFFALSQLLNGGLIQLSPGITEIRRTAILGSTKNVRIGRGLASALNQPHRSVDALKKQSICHKYFGLSGQEFMDTVLHDVLFELNHAHLILDRGAIAQPAAVILDYFNENLNHLMHMSPHEIDATVSRLLGNGQMTS